MAERELLPRLYNGVLRTHRYGNNLPYLLSDVSSHCTTVLAYQETRKAVVTVLITLLLKKVAMPQQDVRMHQASMSGGFSGRGLDTDIVTPFMKEQEFRAMSESGWLTRSLEQAAPYTLDYPGKISPPHLKNAFLDILHAVQSGHVSAKVVLQHILLGLIETRERNRNVKLTHSNDSSSSDLSVRSVMNNIAAHYNRGLLGASRIPVLAIYSILRIVTREMDRYAGCEVLPLESHTAADSKTNLVGDVHVIRSDGTIYEGYEIKHRIPITSQLIRDCYEKFRTVSIDRFYILTTHYHDDYTEFEPDVRHIADEHGCQVIVNGVDRTLMYYLRLVRSPQDFLEEYVYDLEKDASMSYDLKMAWNEIVQSG